MKKITEKRFRIRSILSFATLFILLIGSFSVFTTLRHQPGREEDDELPAPFRKVLEFNERIWLTLYNPNKVDKIDYPAPPKGKKPRFNGDIGIKNPIDIKNWKMTVATPPSAKTPTEMSFTLDQIKSLPKVEYVNQFKCIEGWSEVIAFTGVRFRDFLNHYHLGTHSGNPVDLENHPEDLFSYVGLETPDGEYYVSIDMVSMLSSQTLLAYEMNGEPLSPEQGAPLRLAIPSKYGVKNIKRIGKIQFADAKLPDFWGERGYDWFIGL